MEFKRKMIVGIFIVYLVFEALSIFGDFWSDSVLKTGAPNLVVDAIRIFFGFLLFYHTYKGNELAKIVTGILFLIGAVLSTCAIVILVPQIQEIYSLSGLPVTMPYDLNQVKSLFTFLQVMIALNTIFYYIAGFYILTMKFIRVEEVEEEKKPTRKRTTKKTVKKSVKKKSKKKDEK